MFSILGGMRSGASSSVRSAISGFRASANWQRAEPPRLGAWHGQVSLFAPPFREEGPCHTSFSRVERIDLGDGAWVEFHPSWAAAPDALFRLLRQETAWHGHTRVMYERRVAVPRLTGTPAPASASERALAPLGNALSARYGRPLHDVSYAFYRDGSDSVAMHGDKLGPAIGDSIVAIVSLGCTRRFLLKRAVSPSAVSSSAVSSGAVSPSVVVTAPVEASSRFWTGPDRLEFRPAEGDLLVMGGTCQSTWLHGVPKVAHAGERLAVMFR